MAWIRKFAKTPKNLQKNPKNRISNGHNSAQNMYYGEFLAPFCSNRKDISELGCRIFLLDWGVIYGVGGIMNEVFVEWRWLRFFATSRSNRSSVITAPSSTANLANHDSFSSPKSSKKPPEGAPNLKIVLISLKYYNIILIKVSITTPQKELKTWMY